MADRFFFVKKNKNVWDVEKRADGPWMQYADHEHALAEKDREIQQIREHEFQNGYREAEAIWEEKYQQLMEKAVRFAEAVTCKEYPGIAEYIAASNFLESPEVQAWKEQKP